jgi:hypothetical protein
MIKPKSENLTDSRRLPVNLDTIVNELKRERDRLNRAIAALEESNSRITPGRRRAVLTHATSNGKGQGRHLTPAGRRRVSEMMKKRWAERRKKNS